MLADQGDARAQFEIAICLYEGSGVEMNRSTAAAYFKISADQ
jgi:TPR repeat protein